MGRETTFSVEKAEESSGFLLWQVTTIWQRAIRKTLKPHGLTHAQFVLLASLAWLGRTSAQVNQAQLARHAKLDVMMTSQVLRTLENKGLIVRLPHPIDPRANVLSITDSGRELAMRAIPDIERTDREFFQSVENTGINTSLLKLIAANDPHS